MRKYFYSRHTIACAGGVLSSAHPCLPNTALDSALLLLTALNFLNYIDRNVLFAVQPLVQKEFHLDDAQVGFLTSAFFVCYMVAAPLIAPLADRYPRKWIMAAGAFVWSAATLLSAVTHTYRRIAAAPRRSSASAKPPSSPSRQHFLPTCSRRTFAAG